MTSLLCILAGVVAGVMLARYLLHGVLPSEADVARRQREIDELSAAMVLGPRLTHAVPTLPVDEQQAAWDVLRESIQHLPETMPVDEPTHDDALPTDSPEQFMLSGIPHTTDNTGKVVRVVPHDRCTRCGYFRQVLTESTFCSHCGLVGLLPSPVPAPGPKPAAQEATAARGRSSLSDGAENTTRQSGGGNPACCHPARTAPPVSLNPPTEPFPLAPGFQQFPT